ALLAIAVPGSSAARPSSTPTFATPIYVDQQLAGGEPEVFADTLHGRLIYSSHEGTTHLYRDGLLNSPWGDFSFVSNYCNQVNVWTSTDAGVNWFRDRYLGTQCPTSPAINTGFSDPDLTMDAGGRIYDAGIDVSTWSRGDAAFTPHFITHTSLVGFFPAIAIDAADTIYTAWTPNARQPGTSGGCAGAETPAPNSVMLAYSTDFGRTWSQPL